MCFSLQRRAFFPHLNFKKWSVPLSFLTFWLANVLLATAACNFSTSELQKVVRTCSVLCILTWKWASRYSGVQFFNIATSKSGPNLQFFKMCFSLQRRAIFPHRNFKKWSEHAVSCTFWLENVLLATAACNFSTSQLPKVVRTCSVLYILTWKCASRYSGVQFFHIATSKSGPNLQCFVHFELKMCFSLQRRASKSGPNLVCFVHFDLKMCFSLQRRAIFSTAPSAPALTRLLFDPADPQIIEKHSISRLP